MTLMLLMMLRIFSFENARLWKKEEKSRFVIIVFLTAWITCSFLLRWQTPRSLMEMT